jgi:hypothetical protein
MACEIAAHRPERVSKMIVLDPIGLWRDDAPVAQYMLMTPEQLVTTLYKHLDSPAVQAALRMPSDPKQVAASCSITGTECESCRAPAAACGADAQSELLTPTKLDVRAAQSLL